MCRCSQIQMSTWEYSRIAARPKFGPMRISRALSLGNWLAPEISAGDMSSEIHSTHTMSTAQYQRVHHVGILLYLVSGRLEFREPRHRTGIGSGCTSMVRRFKQARQPVSLYCDRESLLRGSVLSSTSRISCLRALRCTIPYHSHKCC